MAAMWENRARLSVFLLMLAMSASGFGQSNFATIRGTVSDPQGRPIAGAKFVATSVENSLRRGTVSNEAGLYEFSGLQPGVYQLRAEAGGFKTTSQTVTLEVSQQLTLDLPLQLGAVTNRWRSPPSRTS
jgi:hypothetical protein